MIKKLRVASTVWCVKNSIINSKRLTVLTMVLFAQDKKLFMVYLNRYMITYIYFFEKV